MHKVMQVQAKICVGLSRVYLHSRTMFKCLRSTFTEAFDLYLRDFMDYIAAT